MMPRLSNTPGLVWRPRANGAWEARWQARTDLVKKGYRPKSYKVWTGTEAELDEATAAFIQDKCNSLQDEMLVFGRGGIQTPAVFNGTIESLVRCYQTDEDSPYKKLRFSSRGYYDRILNRIVTDHGDKHLTEVRARDLVKWYEKWTEGGTIAMGHSLVGMVRTIVNFGVAFIEDEECERLSGGMSKLRFSMAKPRSERLTAEMAIAVRKRAWERGQPSIALAQAFQFDCILRQKDVIGEWVPGSEPGLSDIVRSWRGQPMKWLRGIRWEEIGPDMVLRHVTSKRNKLVEIPLRDAPMVMEELACFEGRLPDHGPIILDELERKGEEPCWPWMAHNFRRVWREIADEAGVPKSIRNMDSRAGAISEATDAGADLEHIRQAATHSDISMTQRYSRGAADKTANVMRIRAEHRNKKGTK
jgi:hypothetical protein